MAERSCSSACRDRGVKAAQALRGTPSGGCQMEGLRHTSLGIILQSAVRDRLEPGWVYFASADALQFETPCLLIPYALDLSEFGEDGIETLAAREGFPVCGLDSDTILQVVEGLRNTGIGISDKSLLQSFV